MVMEVNPFDILPEDEAAASSPGAPPLVKDGGGAPVEPTGEDPGSVYSGVPPEEPVLGYPVDDEPPLFYGGPAGGAGGGSAPLDPVAPEPAPAPDPTVASSPVASAPATEEPAPVPAGPVPTPDENVAPPLATPPLAATPSGVPGTFKVGSSLSPALRTPSFRSNRVVGSGRGLGA